MSRKAFARFGSHAIVMHAVSAFSDTVRYGTPRVMLPRIANVLLLVEAVSPPLGDLIARALSLRPVVRRHVEWHPGTGLT